MVRAIAVNGVNRSYSTFEWGATGTKADAAR